MTVSHTVVFSGTRYFLLFFLSWNTTRWVRRILAWNPSVLYWSVGRRPDTRGMTVISEFRPVSGNERTKFPSESKLRSARDMGNYYSQTSTFQAPLYKSFFMRTPCLVIGRLKPWWVEIFLRKKFFLIIPAFRWATNSPARFYTIIHLPPLVGMPFTRNRGPGIHCRCNLRCKTKSSNQQSLSPWSNIEYLLCIFQFSVLFLHQCMPIIVH